MTNDEKTIAQLRAHLHRHGKYFYYWTLEGKTSQWYAVGKTPAILSGKFNVYFGVHPTDKPRGKTQRATNDDVCAINCLFADMDAKSFGGEKSRALAHIRGLEPRPSVIVDSGGGYHCYWLLRNAFDIQKDADRKRAKLAQANWVAFVGGDKGAKDLARVLRVPGTRNYKPEYGPNFPMVEILEAFFHCVYSLDELEKAAQPKADDRKTKQADATGNGNGHGKYAQAALVGELDKLQRATDGTRNTQLNASAYSLGQLVGAGALARSDVESNLMTVAHSLGLPEREIITTIRSGIDAGIKEPRIIPSNGNGNGRGAHAANETGETATLEEQGAQYIIKNGRICRRKKTMDGIVTIPLCNFTAEIVEEVALDDGAEVKRKMSINGLGPNGCAFPQARIDASQFESMGWVTDKWGSRAIVEAGSSAKGHLRVAIQYLSKNVQPRDVFVHTGWREINGTRVFLTRTGALGGSQVSVELDKEIERYALPLSPQDVKEAMQASLRFLDIAPQGVTVPLWSAMYLAPLAEIISLRFMLWMYGGTGRFKSALTAVALSHFGDYSQDDLVQWDNTTNSLGKYLFQAKDVPFVIDDFAPQSDSVSMHKLEQVVGQTVRHVGNRSGRGRLDRDLNQRAIYRPRGLVISTGEQLPSGHSLVGRLVTVEVNKGDVDVSKLSTAQDDREAYPDAMAAYILWLANQWDTLAESLPAQWHELRAKARKENQHARLPESIASLYVGLNLGLEFAVQVGAINAKQAHEKLMEGWVALGNVAEHQYTITEDQRPTRRFLSVIGELLAQGKARLNSVETPEAIGDGEKLGWCDDDYIYLLPSAAYHCVAKYERDEGRVFGVKESALRKALAEEGITTVSDGVHLSDRVRVGGEQRRVLKIAQVSIEKIAGQSFKSGQCGLRK